MTTRSGACYQPVNPFKEPKGTEPKGGLEKCTRHRCGHVCYLWGDKCCACSDLRPCQYLYMRGYRDLQYDAMMKRRVGCTTYTANRTSGYCPSCRRKSDTIYTLASGQCQGQGLGQHISWA
jgi:hypothetical protein